MEYLPIFSIILSLLSFVISLLAYKKFHPREIEKKQIEDNLNASSNFFISKINNLIINKKL